MVGPPFTITEGEIDRVVECLRESIDAASAVN
jgi:adenosylmethionine-8-amino-7-oxononanoate aminotransferase